MAIADDVPVASNGDTRWTGGVSTFYTVLDLHRFLGGLADAASESYTAVYDSDRDILVRVRDGGATPIKTFEGNGTSGSTSSSLAAIRTSDAYAAGVRPSVLGPMRRMRHQYLGGAERA